MPEDPPAYLVSAARTLERILRAKHPERVWIAEIRECHENGRPPRAPAGTAAPAIVPAYPYPPRPAAAERGAA